MSEFQNIPVGKQAQEMDISPQFQPYSGVEIVVSEDTAYFAGNRSGRVLQIENPWGTQAQANNILASLTQSGFQYQPYTATAALVNPAAELGDAVSVNGVYSGIYKINRDYSSLMATDIEAPQDEEVDHEFPYEPKQDRIYKREIADARAQISITQSEIASEVTRATAAEGTLSSRITQNANNITAKVSSSGGNNSSFAWSLDTNGFSLVSSNSTVFRCTRNGVEINGTVRANSGTIGGFTVTDCSIYNGTYYLWQEGNGVFIGPNGISVGGANGFVAQDDGRVWASNLIISGGSIKIGNNFSVDSSGNVSANNMRLSGTLNVGGTNISAAVLRSGAQSAYSNGGTWSTGAGYGYNYNNATKQNTTQYPRYFKCGNLVVDSVASLSSCYVNSLYVNSTRYSPRFVTIGGSSFYVLAT